MLLFLSHFITIVNASLPNVGVEKGQEFVWKTEYHNSAFEDLILDSLTYNGHEYLVLKNYLGSNDDYIFIKFNINVSNWYWTEPRSAILRMPSVLRTTEAVKIVINDVDYSKKDYVNLFYNFYRSKNRAEYDWEKKKEIHDKIHDYKSDLYCELFSEKWVELYESDVKVDYLTWGGNIKSRILLLQWYEFYPDARDFMYFIDKDTRFNRIIKKLQNEYTSSDYDINSFHYYESDNKFTINLDEDEDDKFKERNYIFRYSDNGVLLYYKWEYGGDTIMRLELEWSFLILYQRWIIIGIISFLGILIIIMLFIRHQHSGF